MEQRKAKAASGRKPGGLLCYLRLQALFLPIYAAAYLLGSCVAFALNDSSNAQYEIVMAALLAASVICGFLAARRRGENGWLTGLLGCLPLSALVLAASVAVNRFSADWTLPLSGIMLLIGSMLGGILAVNRRQKPKIARRKGSKR